MLASASRGRPTPAARRSDGSGTGDRLPARGGGEMRRSTARASLFFAPLVFAALVFAAACTPGTPDLGYSPTGAVVYGPAFASDGVQSLVGLADGSVVATGSSSRPLTHIGVDGVVDPTWGSTLPTDCRPSG